MRLRSPEPAAVFMGAVLAAEAAMNAPRISETPLGRLLRVAEVGSDPAFSRFLEATRKRPDHSAPAALRGLLASLETLSSQGGQAYSHEDGEPVLIWWFSELGVAGTVETVTAALEEGLESRGFQASARERHRSVFSRIASGVRQEAVVEAPHPRIGGKRAACAFRLRWTVSGAGRSPMPAIDRLLRELPMLRDPRLEGSLYDALADLKVVSLAAGGARTRYYDWDATFAPGTAGDGVELLRSLEALLAKLGFSHDAAQGGGPLAYRRERTGSFAWLHPPDGKGRVRLRIQPES